MIVGITGGIGSGKSIVSRCLREMGYLVFNADTVAADLLNSDIQVALQVVELLGQESYHPDGTANRSFIASQVFQNQQHLDALNSILHPAVDQAFKTWIQENRKHRLLFKEAAILFESGAYKSVDQVLAVVAPEELRIKRVQQRDGRSRDEVVKIMRNQMNQDELIHRSDFVIHNDDQNMVLPALISVLNMLGENP